MSNSHQLKNYLNKWPVILYSILRIIAGIYIIFDPVLGFFATLFLDALDGPLFEQKANFVEMPLSVYTRWDKYLDWWGYVFMYVASLKIGFSWILTLSILFRLVGQVIFEKNKKRYIFVFFPNFFEALFLWYVIFAKLNINLNAYWLVIILVIYEIREFLLHVYWLNRIRKHGYPKWQIRYLGFRKKFEE